MISCERSSWVSRLPAGRRTSAGAGKRGQDVLVEEVGERSVPDVVEQAGHPQRLDDQALGRDAGRRPRAGSRAGSGRATAPRARLVHDAQAVGEARVLGGREDPARALELADPAQPLEPGGVEQVLLGDVLVRQAGGRGLGRRQALGQLDVPVDRVADEVDRGERVAAHQAGRAPSGAPVRVGDVIAQAGRGDDLDVGAPLQDPQPDLDRARDGRPPARASRRRRSRATGSGARSPRGRGSPRLARSAARPRPAAGRR